LLVHLIAEYARHAGHADLLREGIDGRTRSLASLTERRDVLQELRRAAALPISSRTARF